MNKDTIEQLILSKRGRGNIISICYDYKWFLAETERQELPTGEIYGYTMKLPLPIRQRVFDGSELLFMDYDVYLIQKSKEVVLAIKPEFEQEDVGVIVNMAGSNIIGGGPQDNPDLEYKRRDLIFAWAVRGFLRHL